MVSTGKTLAWGSYSAGGYTIVGSIVIVNIRVQLNAVLTANTEYYISGFPLPVATVVPATCSFVSTTKYTYMTSDGRLAFTSPADVPSTNALTFHACYTKQ